MAPWPDHVVQLPPTAGHRWVVGDVHGCARTLHALVSTLSLGPADQLIFLGDYVDRGPDNVGVLDAVMQWQEQGRTGSGPHVFALMGNHEFAWLDEVQRAEWAGDDRYLALYARMQKCHDLLQKGPKGLFLPQHYRQWFMGLPKALITEGWWLVHGSVNTEATPPLADEEALLWGRYTDPEAIAGMGIRVIHGHTPTPLAAIEARIQRKAPVVPLDGGAVFGPVAGLGHLLALNLDTWQLHITPQIDGVVHKHPPER